VCACENAEGETRTVTLSCSSPAQAEMNSRRLGLPSYIAPVRAAHGDRGIEVITIEKSFKNRLVVEDVSLSVRRGEVVGLLGTNGSGKTTCFDMITGLVSPDRGTVRLDGSDIGALPMYKRARLGIGYLPQEPSIFRGLDVESNLRVITESTEKTPERCK